MLAYQPSCQLTNGRKIILFCYILFNGMENENANVIFYFRAFDHKNHVYLEPILSVTKVRIELFRLIYYE
jgi:hypothetical protein